MATKRHANANSSKCNSGTYRWWARQSRVVEDVHPLTQRSMTELVKTLFAKRSRKSLLYSTFLLIVAVVWVESATNAPVPKTSIYSKPTTRHGSHTEPQHDNSSSFTPSPSQTPPPTSNVHHSAAPISRPPAGGAMDAILTTVQNFSWDKQSLEKEPLRVYMYSMPVQFNWKMLSSKKRATISAFGPGLFESDCFPVRNDSHWAWGGVPGNFSARFPAYAGNPSVQQHSVEYYLYLSVIQGLPAVRRVADPEEAQVFFVPFFASLSYNANLKAKKWIDRELQVRFVEWLAEQKYWQRSNGRDHIVVAHHPNALKYSLRKFATTMLVVSDFSRNRSKGSFLEKDIVAPYVPFVSPNFEDFESSESWRQRKVLAFFLGRFKRKKGGVIRQKLREVMWNESGFVLKEGKPRNRSIQAAEIGFREAKFCLVPAGDTPSSCRLFDAIMSLCVPVVISQALELPFEDVIDYTEFVIFVPTYRAVREGHVASLLRNVTQVQWMAMHQRIKE